MAELRPHYIDVDLKKNTQYNVPVVTQNDTATHFIIRVTDDGLSDPELLDAYQEITMTSQRPDGESFYLTGTRIPGTNEIEFHLGTDETAFSGSVLASLQFYLVEDASRYTSAQFRYDVKKDLTKNYTPTQREETLVEVVLRDGPVAIQEAKDAKIAVDGALVDLEQDKTAAIGRLDEVTEENKTIFREPVATFAALSTTYPNPEHGTTVRVTSESATYRYSDGSWVKTDEYNPTAIDQVAAQLADTVEETQSALAMKRDRNEKISSTDLDTSSEAKKIQPENASDRLLSLMAGNTPIHATPEPLSTTREKIARKATNFEHIAFIDESTNLFNNNDITPGFSINGSTGESTANSGFNITDFIRVDANQPYTLYKVGRWAWYDYTGAFISSGTSLDPTTPENAFYARFAVSNSSLRDAQINRGSTLLPYEEHWKRFSEYDKTGLEVVPTTFSIDRKAVKSGVINPDLTSYWKAPINLFNKNHLLADKALDYGEIVDSPGYSATASYIRIKPETDYANSETITIDFHVKHENYLSRWQVTPGSFKSPKNAYLARVSVLTDRAASLMLNEGTQALPYEEHVYELQSTPQFPIRIPGGGGEGGGEGGGTIQAFNTPLNYEVAETLDASAEITVCDISENVYIQEIEMSTNGVACELEINIRQEDGSLTPYRLMANDGSGYVPITPENLVAHGTVDFLFSSYETSAHQYKFSMKGRQYADGLQVKVRNNDSSTKNISCRVVGGSYA